VKPAITSPIDYFALPVGVEIFDGEKVYLIRGVEVDKIIWRSWGTEDIKSGNLKKGEYEGAVQDVLRKLQQ
jgi:hypothetical protein